MGVINFFKFIGEKNPNYQWEDIKKKFQDDGMELPIDGKGDIINGKKNGVFVTHAIDWDVNDIGKHSTYLSKKWTYKDGTPNGPFAEYHPNGLVKKVGNHKDGNLDGELKLYYPNREIKMVEHYINGRKNGKQILYFADGVVNSEVDYVGGRKTGEHIVYHWNGQIESKITYNKQGQKEGPYETRAENGDLIDKGEYSGIGDVQKGETIRYGDNNIPVSRYNHDTKHRIWYYKDGTPKTSYIKIPEENSLVNFRSVTTKYYPNGNVESIERKLTINRMFRPAYNVLDGEQISYDEDGNVTKRELYKNDKLVN